MARRVSPHAGDRGRRAVLAFPGSVRGMDRLNHVKIVSPDPEAIDRFLTEVLDIPTGWPLGDPSPDASPPPELVVSPARAGDGGFTDDSVHAFRGDSGSGGRIIGTPESRQFQVLRGENPHIWGVAVGTRNLEQARQRCIER